MAKPLSDPCKSLRKLPLLPGQVLKSVCKVMLRVQLPLANVFDSPINTLLETLLKTSLTLRNEYDCPARTMLKCRLQCRIQLKSVLEVS